MAEGLTYDIVVNGQKALAALRAFSNAVEAVRKQVAASFGNIDVKIEGEDDIKTLGDAYKAVAGAAENVADETAKAMGEVAGAVGKAVKDSNAAFSDFGGSARVAIKQTADSLGTIDDAARAALDAAETEFQQLAQAAQQSADSIDQSFEGVAKDLPGTLDNASAAFGDTAESARDAAAASGKAFTDAGKKISEATEAAAASQDELGDAAKDAAKDATGAFDRVRAAGSNLAGRLRSSFQSVRENWLQVTAAIAGVTTVLVKGFDTFANFDKRIREVGTLLDDVTESSIRTMSREVRELAIRFGQSIETMARAKYDAVSAGFGSAADSALILENAARLAVGGVAEVSETTEVLTKVLNAYALSAKDAQRVSDALFTTVKLGQTTIPQLAASLGNVASLANTAKLPIEDLGAAMAVLTRRIGTAEAVTALRGALQNLAAPTKEAEKAMRDAGIQLKRFENGNLDLVGTLSQFQGLPLDLIRKFVPDTEAANAIAIMGNNVGELKGALDTMNVSANASIDAFNKMAAGSAFTANQMKARLESALVRIGEAVVPVFNAFTQLVEAFSNMPPVMQQTAVAIAGVVTALRILSSVIAGFGLAIGPTGWLITGLSLLATALVGVQLAAGEVVDPLNKFKKDVSDIGLDRATSLLDKYQEKLKSLESIEIPRPEVSDFQPEFTQADPISLQVEVESDGVDKVVEDFDLASLSVDELRERINVLKGVVDSLKETSADPINVPDLDINVDQIKATQDQLQDFLRASNQITLQEYQQYLQQRVSGLAETVGQENATYQQAFLKLQQVNAQIVQNEQQKQDFLAATGRTSNQEYLAILEQRLEATRGTTEAEGLAFLQLEEQIRQVNARILEDDLAKQEALLESGEISLESYREALENRLELVATTLGVESELYRQLQQDIKDVNDEIFQNTVTFFDILAPTIESVYDRLTDSILENLTLSDIKLRDLWETTKRAFIASQLEMLKTYIFAEKSKATVRKQTEIVIIASYIKEAAAALASVGKEVYSALRTAGAFIVKAAGKIYESFASIPFGAGIPIAAGVIAGMVASFNAIKNKVLAFAEGGRVTEPTLGLIGEAGEVEIVTPENDALTVMRELAGAVLDDVRQLTAQRIEVQTVGAAAGFTPADALDIKNLLAQIRDKEISVVTESRVEGGDLLNAVRIAERRESTVTL